MACIWTAVAIRPGLGVTRVLSLGAVSRTRNGMPQQATGDVSGHTVDDVATMDSSNGSE